MLLLQKLANVRCVFVEAHIAVNMPMQLLYICKHGNLTFPAPDEASEAMMSSRMTDQVFAKVAAIVGQCTRQAVSYTHRRKTSEF